MTGLLPSIVVLGSAAVLAAWLTRTRASPAERSSERSAATLALSVALGAQALHFVEEAASGLPDRLGAVFGLQPMPQTFFLAFNLVWLGIWAASVAGLKSGRWWAWFAAWFLSIAGVANGVLHPALAAATGGYFPGLWSAPFVGAAAAWLWLRLLRATRPGRPGGTSSASVPPG